MSFGFGKDFRATIFGESHGKVVGSLVEGCPAGLRLSEEQMQGELDRRKPGGPLSSGREERDRLVVLAGVLGGRTNGGPIVMLVENEDADSSWYDANRHLPRPGHSDYAAHVKYGGFNDHRGGGFFSGRITAGMVMAGSVAKSLLLTAGVRVVAHLVRVGRVASDEGVSDAELEALGAPEAPLRCADARISERMASEIGSALSEGDSVGGMIECSVLNLPVGVGEPIFDSVDGMIAQGVFGIPGVKAIEFGGGFALCGMRGSEANDGFYIKNGTVATKTNNAGGVLGGLTTGMPLVFRVGIKPTPSISMPQQSVDLRKMEAAELRIRGRHDPCIAVRAVPVVEAMTAVCIADLMIRAGKIPRVLEE